MKLIKSGKDFIGANLKISKNSSVEKIEKKNEKSSNQNNILMRYWRIYCEKTTVHGMKYLSGDDLHWTEKLTWSIFVALATLGVVYVSFLLSERYNTSPLSTVVESTYYHITEIPYPAVSICNNNRINYKKFNDAIERFLPEGRTEDTIDTFKLLFSILDTFEFGSFDELEPLLLRDVQELEKLNISQILEFLSITCNDILVECWWRNKYYPCCDLFSQQKSEYGACLSFNSATSHGGTDAINKSADNFPWRSSSSGLWSGLRVKMNLKIDTRFPEFSKPAGVHVIIHNPHEWPNTAGFIPAGTSTSIQVKPTAYYASTDVRRLTPEQRQCVFADEAKIRANNIMSLSGLPYQRPNCICECRQKYMLQYCNCTVDIFYATGVYPACNVTGLLCMNRFNDIFNFEKPIEKSKYFDDSEVGLMCNCLPECRRISYGIEMQPILLSDGSENDTILDVHFAAATMVQYRTDVMFGWLDLMVAFGGIAGLFLGCSLLSGAEMIYYLTIGIFWESKREKKANKMLKEIQHKDQLIDKNLKKNNMLIADWIGKNVKNTDLINYSNNY